VAIFVGVAIGLLAAFFMLSGCAAPGPAGYPGLTPWHPCYDDSQRWCS
jgi:hypothetical protein